MTKVTMQFKQYCVPKYLKVGCLLRKSIHKKTRRNRYESIQHEDFVVSYERNSITNRMNKIWTCNFQTCRKQFGKVCSLKDHIRLHKDERPFTCAYCGIGWSQAGNRDRHQANASCLRGKKGLALQRNLGITHRFEIKDPRSFQF